MGRATKNLLDATINLYRAASGDKVSTLQEITSKFANTPITEPLAHHSRISGKIPSNGSILPGRFEQKGVEEILINSLRKN